LRIYIYVDCLTRKFGVNCLYRKASGEGNPLQVFPAS
jgi:hypothetical protein